MWLHTFCWSQANWIQTLHTSLLPALWACDCDLIRQRLLIDSCLASGMSFLHISIFPLSHLFCPIPLILRYQGELSGCCGLCGICISHMSVALYTDLVYAIYFEDLVFIHCQSAVSCRLAAFDLENGSLFSGFTRMSSSVLFVQFFKLRAVFVRQCDAARFYYYFAICF